MMAVQTLRTPEALPQNVVLFTTSCIGAVERAAEPAERRVQALMDALGVEVSRVYLDLDPQRWCELEHAGYHGAQGPHRLPQLVAGGYLVGGAQELQNLQDEGKLLPVLRVLSPTSFPDPTPLDSPDSWTSPERCGRVSCQARVLSPGTGLASGSPLFS